MRAPVGVPRPQTPSLPLTTEGSGWQCYLWKASSHPSLGPLLIDGTDPFIFIFQKSRQPSSALMWASGGGMISNPALFPAVHSALCGELGEALPGWVGGGKHSQLGALS